MSERWGGIHAQSRDFYNIFNPKRHVYKDHPQRYPKTFNERYPETFNASRGTTPRAGKSGNKTWASESLDGIPGVVPGLVPGFQGWKYPGALAQPCCELKSLKFILSDSNFLCPPALNTLVTLGIYPSVNQEFFFR
jgi:hypothetical protein